MEYASQNALDVAISALNRLSGQIADIEKRLDVISSRVDIASERIDVINESIDSLWRNVT